MSPVDGERIRQLREERDLSQDDLSAQTGIRQPTISAIERGLATHTTVAHLDKIAEALGVAPADLLKPGRRKK